MILVVSLIALMFIVSPGEGRLVTICDIDSPPAYPCMTQMNFPKEYTSIMSSLNWATADEEHAPGRFPRFIYTNMWFLKRCNLVLASHEPPAGAFKSEGQKSRLNKRKLASDTLMRNREDLFAGEYDGYVSSRSLSTVRSSS